MPRLSPVSFNEFVRKLKWDRAWKSRLMGQTLVHVDLTLLKPWAFHRRSQLNYSLKPYSGKPNVWNFKGGAGNVMHDLVTLCHETGNGGYLGSHWSKHVRACSPLDGLRITAKHAADIGNFFDKANFLRYPSLPPVKKSFSHKQTKASKG